MSVEKVRFLCWQMHLTPYQSYILEKNFAKYDLDRLSKRGDVLRAPYIYDNAGGMKEFVARIFAGRRADIIGADRMLSIGGRKR
ncbi:MAG: hypothetical protein LBD50_00840 [Rickettsiales bacterium]|jgi:hypothetical protein|nr:hypothetical protein [Rickettsiales bacterium]